MTATTSQLFDEGFITLPQAATSIPSIKGGSGSVDAATLWKWVVRGVKLPGGKLLRLEAAKIGSCWVTSRAALRRFVAAGSESALAKFGAEPAARKSNRRRSSAGRVKATSRKPSQAPT